MEKTMADETQAVGMRENGMDPGFMMEHVDKVLQPEDIGQTVWETVSKPERCFINEVLVFDKINMTF